VALSTAKDLLAECVTSMANLSETCLSDSYYAAVFRRSELHGKRGYKSVVLSMEVLGNAVFRAGAGGTANTEFRTGALRRHHNGKDYLCGLHRTQTYLLPACNM
jgi:hypothetical protein